jgi:hypothetical protein
MKAYGVVEVKLHAFLISALDLEDRLRLLHGHFTSAESAIVSRLFGGWEDPGVGTKIMENKNSLYPVRNRTMTLDRPACGLVTTPTELQKLNRN